MKDVSTAVIVVLISLGAFSLGWGLSLSLGEQPLDAGLWSAAGAVVTALATIVLVGVTALLWKVTNQSAHSAKVAADAASDSARLAGEASTQAADIAKKQLRAYVLVEGAGLSCDANGQHLGYVYPGSLPIGMVSFKNTGQTPALNLQVQIRIGIRSEPAPNDSFELEPSFPNSIMSLGSNNSSQSMAAAPAPISPASIQNLASNSEAIYVFGEIQYKDIFGDVHTSRFRLRNKSGVFDGSMTFTSQGNSEN